MTLLYYDDRFLEHNTGTHPERAERLRQVMRHLERQSLVERCRRVAWPEVSLERLARVHQPSYVASVQEFADSGGGRIEADTVVSAASFDVAALAAGAAADAVDRVLRGDAKN